MGDGKLRVKHVGYGRLVMGDWGSKKVEDSGVEQ